MPKKHNPNPVWRYALPQGTSVPKPKGCSDPEVKPNFDIASLWIQDNGSAKLKSLLDYHTQVWEASEAMSCVRTRRRRELMWLAYSEGCVDMANLTPESLTEAELDIVYKGSKSASETLAEIALNKGIR